MRKDFAIFILTHGRANNVVTYKTLQKLNYTGKVYFIVDDEDDQYPQYIYNFGKQNVIQFNKQKVADSTDTFDNFNEHKVIIYARRVAFEIAQKLGLKYFLTLDDDYTDFHYRYIKDNKLSYNRVIDMDSVCEAMIEFLETSGALTVAFCQGGDLIGGAQSKRFNEHLIRKAMNAFFCRTDRPINFIGNINEDVNTYTYYGSRGELFFTITDVAIVQLQTQSLKGGMTDVYLENGTFLKSFYSVIVMPSAVKISQIGTNHLRIHHQINWNHCVPKILNEKWKKV